MQNKHKGVTGIHQVRGRFGIQGQKPEQVTPVVIYGQDIVFIPGPGPVHFASEDHCEKEQDKEVVILRDGQFPVRRYKPPEEKEEK